MHLDVFDVSHKRITLSQEMVTKAGRLVHLRKPEFSVLTAVYSARSVFTHYSFYCIKKCQQVASSFSSLELFIASRDKQCLRLIHAALRYTIGQKIFLLIPPSYYNPGAQGEKGFRLQRIISVYMCMCFCAVVRNRSRALMKAFCSVIIKLCNQITK